MQDTLFTSDLMALRKRRANVGKAISVGLGRKHDPFRRGRLRIDSRLNAQYHRTFRHLTVVELRLTDKVAP